MQLSWADFFFFFPSAAYLLLRFSCVTGTVCPLADSLESQRWGTGDMSAVGTMKLPVWFDQSVCKHQGGGWGVRMQCTAFYSLPSSGGINTLHLHLLLAFILSVFFPSFFFVTDSKGKNNTACRSCLCLVGLFEHFYFLEWHFPLYFTREGTDNLIESFPSWL